MGLINRCPHVRISGIYGDEINHCGGYRLSCDDCGRLLDGDVSLAKPAPRIVRTVEELEALDPDSWLMQADEGSIPMILEDWIHDYGPESDHIFPLIVLATGEHVRTARKALEGEHA